MPNPFKRRGSSYHSGDWRAWSLGLLAQLAAALDEDRPSTLALVGDIGSGKTTALDAYVDRIQSSRQSDVFIRIDVGQRAAEQWPDLHQAIYVELTHAFGEAVHDQVVKALNVSARSGGKYLQQHEIYEIVKGMIRHSVGAGTGVHVLVDECQRPAEHYELAGDTTKLHAWFEQLKNLAQAISGGGGGMVMTTTTSPWEAGPIHVRDRFVYLRAEAPDAVEIQAFIDEGLKHTGEDAPTRAEADLGATLKNKFPELTTPRHLHEILWRAWRTAHKAGADVLGAAHLP